MDGRCHASTWGPAQTNGPRPRKGPPRGASLRSHGRARERRPGVANHPAARPTVISLSCWCADRVSTLLQPDEREAVRGDLAELGAGGGEALREVLGLVARRQAHLWTGWRPWLALIGLAVPLGMVL